MSYSDKQLQRDYQRKWLADRRSHWFADKTCVQCGSADHLELDHIAPTDKVSHRIWSWSKVRFDAEIIKCQVLCHSCHLIKTVDFLVMPLVHGTWHGYKHRSCRCDRCRKANAICKATNNWDSHLIRA